MTSATSMDISESFRPEDLSKTDFFDFVSGPPEQENNQGSHNNSNNTNNDQPLQGFDQVSYNKKLYTLCGTPLIMRRDKFLLIKKNELVSELTCVNFSSLYIFSSTSFIVNF